MPMGSWASTKVGGVLRGGETMSIDPNEVGATRAAQNRVFLAGLSTGSNPRGPTEKPAVIVQVTGNNIYGDTDFQQKISEAMNRRDAAGA